MPEQKTPAQMINLTIDGKAVTVARGTNLIKAAAAVGVSVPHYCYHPHLSVPGNCRMCQVKVKGAPKLAIGCHTVAMEGMEVSTHETSQEVRDAQAATLEFILINHPLDCTVCDQAGHCKLQDFHYEYNAKPSRFVEAKVHKVKAEVLGPHVILDGERCIMCTRCIRFCQEITKTNELGMLFRGDRSTIAIDPGRPLNNPLSGTVVDLCPVGALTHRDWRFNTRIWYTSQTDSICPGCSTGCNVKVAVRDRQVVGVKSRLNADVNKEWLCDEGRYGFHRFLPGKRLTAPLANGKPLDWDSALQAAAQLSGRLALIFVSPNLLLEEYALIKQFVQKYAAGAEVALAYRERKLSDVEAVLVSPDYAANFRAAEFSGLVGGNLVEAYDKALGKLRSGSYKQILFVGDGAILPADLDADALSAVFKMELSVGIGCDAAALLVPALKVLFPGRSVLEKAGLMINRTMRLQYSDRVLDFPDGSEPEWRIISRIAGKNGGRLTEAQSDRELTLNCLASEARLAGIKIAAVKAGGIQLELSNRA